MARALLLLVSLALSCSALSDEISQYPSGDVRNCPSFSPQNASQPLHRMEVLPGLGYDNLRNLDMGQVYFYNYSTCKISKDGRCVVVHEINCSL